MDQLSHEKEELVARAKKAKQKSEALRSAEDCGDCSPELDSDESFSETTITAHGIFLA